MTTAGASRRRAVFLDIDGTYASHGAVPEAHADAVRAARANGHVIFLCTGRPVSLIDEHLLAAGFDGIVAGAGAHVTVAGDVVLDVRFDAALGNRMIDALDEAGSHFLIESPEGSYTRQDSYDLLAQRESLAHTEGFEHLGVLTGIVRALEVREDLSTVRFTKLTAFDGHVPLTDLAPLLSDELAVFPSSIADLGAGSGELYLKRITKATGIQAAIDRLGIPREDTVAFGDNLNDLDMIRYAGVGVAMADGRAEVIAAADEVVPGPDDHGVAVGFERLGLVSR